MLDPRRLDFAHLVALQLDQADVAIRTLGQPAKCRTARWSAKAPAPGLDRTDAVGLDMAYRGSDPPGTVSSNPSPSSGEPMQTQSHLGSVSVIANLSQIVMNQTEDRAEPLRIANDRRIAGAVAPQRVDRRIEDRRGSRLLGIADGQKRSRRGRPRGAACLRHGRAKPRFVRRRCGRQVARNAQCSPDGD